MGGSLKLAGLLALSSLVLVVACDAVLGLGDLDQLQMLRAHNHQRVDLSAQGLPFVDVAFDTSDRRAYLGGAFYGTLTLQTDSAPRNSTDFDLFLIQYAP